jgi:hypothetical protein
MTIDQALEMVKSQHVQQQDVKAKAAQERAEMAKAAAEARRKKKAKKVWILTDYPPFFYVWRPSLHTPPSHLPGS